MVAVSTERVGFDFNMTIVAICMPICARFAVNSKARQYDVQRARCGKARVGSPLVPVMQLTESVSRKR
jgi:hypothetical protein